jgi:hypothetical protein
MISHLSYEGGVLLVHLSRISLKTTKAFTHGSLVFGRNSVTFAKLPAVSLPAGFAPSEGVSVTMQLVGPDGEPRKQIRTAILVQMLGQPGYYRVPGQSKTPRRFRAEDGWQLAVYKFRAYFDHPGLNTDAAIPEWLKASIERQRAYWNRLAYLCRDARRKCSPAPAPEIKELSGLVVAQIALSLALLVISGLFLQTLRNLSAGDPGFEQNHVLTASVGLYTAGYSSDEVDAICHKILDRVAVLPTVTVASLTDWMPMNLSRKTEDAYPEGYAPRPHESLEVQHAEVTPRYFETLGVPIIEGRDFAQYDNRKGSVATFRRRQIIACPAGMFRLPKRRDGR